MDDLSFSVEGLLFFGEFSYHKTHNLSASGRKKIENNPQIKPAILKIVPISSNHCLHSCNSSPGLVKFGVYIRSVVISLFGDCIIPFYIAASRRPSAVK